MPDTAPSNAAQAVTVDARTRILDAAERIAQARGVTALTLDAAAKEAGVSKGGLLYHFASKEALLVGLLTRLAAYIEADFEGVLAQRPPGRGRATRAILAWTFDHPDSVCEQHERAAGVFLAAFHQDSALLDPIREVVGRMRQRLAEDGLPPGHSLAVQAACDGLFMWRIFGLHQPTQEEQRGLRTALETLIGIDT